MGLADEGFVGFWLQAEHADWMTNANRYVFQKVERAGITVEAAKDQDRTIEIKVHGLLGRTFTFVHPLPPPQQRRGLHVAIGWERPNVMLYLNGLLTEKVP